MTVWKRMLVIVVLACLVMACIPASAFAVDPVMTTAMANAFAQAVAAYGASQGVSITFDVANTDGIGEGIHELWNEFKTQTQDQDVETFDSYAVTLFYNLFKKSSGGGNNNNNGDDKVAIAISAATVAALDKFWNWLLSGPAEMTKVDNQYQWQLDSNDNVTPISVHASDYYLINGYSVPLLSRFQWIDGNVTFDCTFSSPVACYIRANNSSSNAFYFFMGLAQSQVPYNLTVYNNGSVVSSTNSAINDSSYNGFYYKQIGSRASYELTSFSDVPIIVASSNDPESCFGSFSSSDVETSNNDIAVRPYVYDPIVQPITIPDPSDPDYDPEDLVLPLNLPWDVTLFGNGESPMDDSQAEATVDAVSDKIMTSPDRAIELNPSSDNPITPPSEVYIPFLPVQLPSFNFSLSGIWHYVIDWVASLGAWFTTVFTIWSNLPYAIVLPVYASAVIVIVLGVYKRFFM